MDFKKFLWLGVLAASVFAFTACGDDDGGAKETNCADGKDNDGDGYVDCTDTDCASDPACTGGGETNCTDGFDNDNDGFADCADSDCANNPACTGNKETNCTNQIDDDSDGYTDCFDSDCASDPACGGSGETDCDNDVDDDNDGYTDCDDTDCANDAACTGGGETDCSNEIDDDNNGWTDCQDPACENDPACQSTSGDLSCMGINQCYGCCADQACYDACAAAGSTAAQAQDTAFYGCMSDNCYTECTEGTSEQCNTCVDTNCSAEIEACDWGDGTGGCNALMTCLQGCSGTIPDGTGTAATCPTDPTLVCLNGCFGSTGSASTDMYFAIYDCIDANCATECVDMSSEGCQTCYSNNCANEITSCQND